MSNEEMIRCWYCGKLTPKNKEKCVHCGTILLSESDEIDIDEFLDLVENVDQNKKEEGIKETIEEEIPKPFDSKEKEKNIPSVTDVPKPPLSIEEEPVFEEKKVQTPPPPPPTVKQEEKEIRRAKMSIPTPDTPKGDIIEYQTETPISGLDIPKPPTNLEVPEEKIPSIHDRGEPPKPFGDIPEIPKIKEEDREKGFVEEGIPIPPSKNKDVAGVPTPPIEKTAAFEVPKPEIIEKTEVPAPSIPAPKPEEKIEPPKPEFFEEKEKVEEIKIQEPQPAVKEEKEEKIIEVKEEKEEVIGEITKKKTTTKKDMLLRLRFFLATTVIMFLEGFSSIKLENPNYYYQPLSFPDPNQVKINKIIFVLIGIILFFSLGYLVKEIIINQIEERKKTKIFVTAIFYTLGPIFLSSIIAIIISVFIDTQFGNYNVLQINLFGATIIPWIQFFSFGWLFMVIGYILKSQSIAKLEETNETNNSNAM